LGTTGIAKRVAAGFPNRTPIPRKHQRLAASVDFYSLHTLLCCTCEVSQGEFAMDLGVEGITTDPSIKKALKYGSIGFAVLDFVKTLAELPATLKTDSHFAAVVGITLWHLIRFPLEFVALVICVYFGIAFACAFVPFRLLDLDEHKGLRDFVIFVSIVWAIWLAWEHGVVGTFSLIAGYFENLWWQLTSGGRRR